jgi:hypothetical protein
MATSTRRFFLTAGAAFLGAALSASAAVDAALLGLIPADATVVSGVHVEQAKASAFGRFALSQMQLDEPGFRTFISDTGFDPRRDLGEVLIATIGSTAKPDALIVGRGVFNPGRIFNTAKLHGANVATYRGVDIASHDDGALAFVDAGIALAGSATAVRAAIDQRANSQKLPEAVVRKMQELSAANDVWFYSTTSPANFFAGKMSNENLGAAMGDGLMQSVVQAAGGIKFTGSNAIVSGEAVTRSDKDATALADVFRFLAQVMQSGNQQRTGAAADAASLLTKLQVSTQGNVMKVGLAIPEDVLERLFGRRSMHVARR